MLDYPSTYVSDIRQGLRSVLNNRKFSDITFIVDGKAIYAIKSIVSSRSAKLAGMLRSGMRESQQNCIHITNYRYEVFMKVLEYLYFDEVEPSPDDAVELLMAANEYMLDHLKMRCENVVVDAICLENVVELLVNAINYNAMRLKAACLQFLLLHPQLCEGAAFQELDPQIKEEVLALIHC